MASDINGWTLAIYVRGPYVQVSGPANAFRTEREPARESRSVSGLGCDGRALVIAPKVLTRRSLGWQTRLKQSVNQPHVQLTKVSQEASPLLVQSLLVLFLVQSGRQLDHHDQPKTS
ncbi:hypothetical protein FAM19404_00823 [Lacticaseibacillus paracasei]|nr:hypothetical protein FAM19404_00823 [Lacticaseibacillus paracasei]